MDAVALPVGLDAHIRKLRPRQRFERGVQGWAEERAQLGLGALHEALERQRVVHAARECPARVDQHAVEVEGDAQKRPDRAAPACLTRSNSGDGTMPPASVASPNTTATTTTSGSAARLPSEAATV